MRILLANRQQGHQAIKAAWEKVKEQLQAGQRFVLSIDPENKSREQEEKYHAMIGVIAKQAQHLGAKWDTACWKRLLVNKFCKEIGLYAGRVIPNLDGDGIVSLDFQTRNFTKEQASQFIEWLYAWMAENGVTDYDVPKD